MKNYKSLTDALDDLKQRGYKEDFKTQTTCLCCGDIDVRLDPQDFNIDESCSTALKKTQMAVACCWQLQVQPV